MLLLTCFQKRRESEADRLTDPNISLTLPFPVSTVSKPRYTFFFFLSLTKRPRLWLPTQFTPNERTRRPNSRSRTQREAVSGPPFELAFLHCYVSLHKHLLCCRLVSGRRSQRLAKCGQQAHYLNVCSPHNLSPCS